jgi:hypothetical protein
MKETTTTEGVRMTTTDRTTKFQCGYRGCVTVIDRHENRRVEFVCEPPALDGSRTWVAANAADAEVLVRYRAEEAERHARWVELKQRQYPGEEWGVPQVEHLVTDYSRWYVTAYSAPAVHHPASRDRCVCDAEVVWLEDSQLGCGRTGEVYGDFWQERYQGRTVAEVEEARMDQAWVDAEAEQRGARIVVELGIMERRVRRDLASGRLQPADVAPGLFG